MSLKKIRKSLVFALLSVVITNNAGERFTMSLDVREEAVAEAIRKDNF